MQQLINHCETVTSRNMKKLQENPYQLVDVYYVSFITKSTDNIICYIEHKKIGYKIVIHCIMIEFKLSNDQEIIKFIENIT